MPLLIPAVLAAASTTICILVAMFTGRAHVQEFAGFLAIVGVAATLALSVGAVGQRSTRTRGAQGWAKAVLEVAVFIVLLPVTLLVTTVAVFSVYPLFLMLLPVARPSEDRERAPEDHSYWRELSTAADMEPHAAR